MKVDLKQAINMLKADKGEYLEVVIPANPKELELTEFWNALSENKSVKSLILSIQEGERRCRHLQSLQDVLNYNNSLTSIFLTQAKQSEDLFLLYKQCKQFSVPHTQEVRSLLGLLRPVMVALFRNSLKANKINVDDCNSLLKDITDGELLNLKDSLSKCEYLKHLGSFPIRRAEITYPYITTLVEIIAENKAISKISGQNNTFTVSHSRNYLIL